MAIIEFCPAMEASQDFQDYMNCVNQLESAEEKMGKDRLDKIDQHFIECEQCRNNFIDYVAQYHGWTIQSWKRRTKKKINS